MYGTLDNPMQITPGSIVTQEQDAQRRAGLADALMAQQLQAGPSKGLNLLLPFLQVAASNFQNRRADRSAGEALDKRLTWEGQQKRAARDEERAYQRDIEKQLQKQREANADAWGLKGRQRAVYIADGKIIDDPKPARHVVKGSLVDENGNVLYSAPQEPRAPAAPHAMSFDDYQNLTPEERAEYDRFKGRPPRTDPTQPKPPSSKDQRVAAGRGAALDNAERILGEMEQMLPSTGPMDQYWPGENQAKFSKLQSQLLDVWKGVVRQPGEGTFTEGDRDALMQALPKLGDRQEVNAATIGSLREQIAGYRKGLGHGASALAAEAESGGSGGEGGHKVGSVITVNGKRYRVVGGDPSDPDVEPID